MSDLADSVFPLCYIPSEGAHETNLEAVRNQAPQIIGSCFCVGSDATHWYFLTARHNFTEKEKEYVEERMRLFVAVRPKNQYDCNLLRVVYKGGFKSPTDDDYEEGDFVLIKCPLDALSRVVPLPVSPEVARIGDKVEHLGVSGNLQEYVEKSRVLRYEGTITKLSHFLNRQTMNSSACYVTSAEIPQGLSGGCCLLNGKVIGVNVTGLEGRSTVESVMQLTKHHKSSIFFPSGSRSPSQWLYAPFVVSNDCTPVFHKLDGSSVTALTESITKACGYEPKGWHDGVFSKLNKGIWIENFRVTGTEKEALLTALLAELMAHYKNTHEKVPVCITPLEAVYP